jgi:hypothetical protein
MPDFRPRMDRLANVSYLSAFRDRKRLISAVVPDIIVTEEDFDERVCDDRRDRNAGVDPRFPV